MLVAGSLIVERIPILPLGSVGCVGRLGAVEYGDTFRFVAVLDKPSRIAEHRRRPGRNRYRGSQHEPHIEG
jgi:hypothetical protein